MAKVTNNRYYPSAAKTGELHDSWRMLFDHMYEQQRRNSELSSQLDDLRKSHSALSAQVANGPSTTKIQGLNVKAVQPTNGQSLKYNAATGEIEWTT
jgi:hypothetical protein